MLEAVVTTDGVSRPLPPCPDAGVPVHTVAQRIGDLVAALLRAATDQGGHDKLAKAIAAGFLGNS